jgi:hypothetical protein
MIVKDPISIYICTGAHAEAWQSASKLHMRGMHVDGVYAAALHTRDRCVHHDMIYDTHACSTLLLSPCRNDFSAIRAYTSNLQLEFYALPAWVYDSTYVYFLQANSVELSHG